TRPPRYSRAAMLALRAHGWPGNVRELRNIVERVCLLREGKAVRLQDLPEAVQEAAAGAGLGDAARAAETREVSLDRPLDESIDAILHAALELEDGNRSRAARRLGVSLRTMQRFAARGGTSRPAKCPPGARAYIYDIPS